MRVQACTMIAAGVFFPTHKLLAKVNLSALLGMW